MGTLRWSWRCSSLPWYGHCRVPLPGAWPVSPPGRPLLTMDMLSWLPLGPLSALNLRNYTSLAILGISESSIALLSNQWVAWATALRSPLALPLLHGSDPAVWLVLLWDPYFCCCSRVSAEMCRTLTFLCSVLQLWVVCLLPAFLAEGSSFLVTLWRLPGVNCSLEEYTLSGLLPGVLSRGFLTLEIQPRLPQRAAPGDLWSGFHSPVPWMGWRGRPKSVDSSRA